jgi:hypothetical protein
MPFSFLNLSSIAINFNKYHLMLLIAWFVVIPKGFSQANDSLAEPLIKINKGKFFKDLNIGFDMRTEFQAYRFSGGDEFPRGMLFENGFTALRISGRLHERVDFTFRNRFNRTTAVQSLDNLSSDIEFAFLKIKASEQLDLYIGKMFAFYGGYEYEYSPLYILEFNDIYSNALAFVTGAGLSYQAFDQHQFRFQVLNSRTLRYEDLYGDVVSENIQEPIWPVNFVGNWRGQFFDGQFETNYSASYSNEVRNRGTYFITLGHKYKSKDLSIMYDFQYSKEDIDTKGIVSTLLDDELAEDVLYVENWLRAEYRFSRKFQGLITLMSSTAYDNFTTSRELIRMSYGAIPTIYYNPFKKIDIRFFMAYIGRYYDYSDYAKQNLGVESFNKNELRIGILAPLNLL